MEYEDQTTGEAWRALRERAGMGMAVAAAAMETWEANRFALLERSDLGIMTTTALALLRAYGLRADGDGVVSDAYGTVVGWLVVQTDPRVSVRYRGRTVRLVTVAGVRPLASEINARCPDDAEADRWVRLVMTYGAAHMRPMVLAQPWAAGMAG